MELTNSNDIISNDTSIQQTQTVAKRKIYCKECNSDRPRMASSKHPQICHVCYKYKTLELSGNKNIDDFIRNTQIKYAQTDGKMVFVPYDKFENVEFIAEGGFSKIYKATWIGARKNRKHVVLKKLDNSTNITSKELNELEVFYNAARKVTTSEISKYIGATQDPITNELIIIMPYYDSGDLMHYITKDFYKISWEKKLENLREIMKGLYNLHEYAKIVHRDLHSGNILCGGKNKTKAVISDLGLSKSATSESTDDNENYGIIPYMAPEIFEGKKYTMASDIYSFGMIMWEIMTGRRPFWDRNHDTDLIIEIVDGLRPPIVTNAPEGYIELMKECWHPDPEKRPTAYSMRWGKFDETGKIIKIIDNERKNPTKIIKSPDIGPVTYNPNAIYTSRALSSMIKSAMSLRSLRTQSTDSFYYRMENDPNSTDKRKFADNFEDNHDDGKRIKYFSNENDDLIRVNFAELDRDPRLDKDTKNTKKYEKYITKEVNFDI